MVDDDIETLDSEQWTGFSTSEDQGFISSIKNPELIIGLTAIIALTLWVSGIAAAPQTFIPNIISEIGSILLEASIIIVALRWIDKLKKNKELIHDTKLLNSECRHKYYHMCRNIISICNTLKILIDDPNRRYIRTEADKEIIDFTLHNSCMDLIGAFPDAVRNSNKIRTSLIGTYFTIRVAYESYTYVKQIDYFSNLNNPTPKDYDQYTSIKNAIISKLKTCSDNIDAIRDSGPESLMEVKIESCKEEMIKSIEMLEHLEDRLKSKLV